MPSHCTIAFCCNIGIKGIKECPRLVVVVNGQPMDGVAWSGGRRPTGNRRGRCDDRLTGTTCCCLAACCDTLVPVSVCAGEATSVTSSLTTMMLAMHVC